MESEAVNRRTTSPVPDAQDDDSKSSTLRPERNSVVPPYWQRPEPNKNRLSSHSVDLRPNPIRLEDHTDEGSEQLNALWAKHVTIPDYVIVGNSAAPAFGAYVVFNVTVDTLDVSMRLIQ
jgi:hypothetical protein